MRITGHRILTLAAQAAVRNQADVADAGRRLTSGKRVERPSDDPLAWAEMRRAETRRAVSEGRGLALGAAHDDLLEGERVLTTIADALVEGRELAIQAGNASLGATERAALGERVEGLFQLALAAANTRGSSGEYLLAGSASLTAPFDATGAYGGDGATRTIELAEGATAQATVAGTRLTAAAGVDVLPALARLRAALAADDLPTIQTAIGELATAGAQVNAARSDVGAIRGVIAESDGLRRELEDGMVAQVARLGEADLVTAASAFTRAASALSASQAVSARLASLLAPDR